MTIFFCILLTIVILCGKAESWQSATCLVVIDVALIFAILITGGYL